MTLDEWRRQEGLSFEALARRFGLSSATHARRYALGTVEVPADMKERVINETGGAVTLDDFHKQRLSFCLRRGDVRRLSSANVTDPKTSENGNRAEVLP